MKTVKQPFYTYSGLLAGLLILFSACTKKFSDYNTDPSAATEEMLGYDNLSTGVFFPQMQQNIFPVAQPPGFRPRNVPDRAEPGRRCLFWLYGCQQQLVWVSQQYDLCHDPQLV